MLDHHRIKGIAGVAQLIQISQKLLFEIVKITAADMKSEVTSVIVLSAKCKHPVSRGRFPPERHGMVENQKGFMGMGPHREVPDPQRRKIVVHRPANTVHMILHGRRYLHSMIPYTLDRFQRPCQYL